MSGVFVVFFFRQKTAYEMRISDWSSDVCSSDLDRVASIGMFEHVGVRNYTRFFEQVRGHLREQGLALLHTIGSNVSATHTDPWIGKYIFPNSMLPSAAQITRALERLLVIEDL